MDPQQSWIDMLTALNEKRWGIAREQADALYEWIRKGGFPPVTVGDQSLGKKWHAAIASFTCLAVANKVDDIRKRRRAKGGV